MIEFYFDVISPYVWLASHQLKKIQNNLNLEIQYTPVLFAGLLDAHGNLGPAEIPAKRKYTVIDTMRWAKKYGLQYQGPPQHPFNPLKALRSCLYFENNEQRAKWLSLLLDACWSQGRDISQESTLLDLAKSLKIDGEQLLESISSPEIKNKLKQNTLQAVEHGVFGVPTFRVENQIFWGHDRLELLELHLQDKLDIDLKKCEEILQRPRAVDRKKI
ncbi:MAG: 2-hydroxychromene-2-carboxylate isomerase [Deltaproteobacteria bacterium]|nr:2-hydroxychromene-2-carboxylate isomerase [Deltaproteobacteria bacterium]